MRSKRDAKTPSAKAVPPPADPAPPAPEARQPALRQCCPKCGGPGRIETTRTANGYPQHITDRSVSRTRYWRCDDRRCGARWTQELKISEQGGG